MLKETKHDKFVRLAETRTNKIINMIQLLGNCSNNAVYEYSIEEVNKIFATIQKELDISRQRFTIQNTKKSEKKFKL